MSVKEDPDDPGPTANSQKSVAGDGLGPSELQRMGDAKDRAKIKPVTSASEFVPSPTIPVRPGPKRKLVEQTQALAVHSPK